MILHSEGRVLTACWHKKQPIYINLRAILVSHQIDAPQKPLVLTMLLKPRPPLRESRDTQVMVRLLCFQEQRIKHVVLRKLTRLL